MSNQRAGSAWNQEASDEDSADDSAPLIQGGVSSYQAIARQHEQGLERLGEAIRRQKHMAAEIGGEVELHNELLEHIERGVDRTGDKLRKNVRNIRLVGRHSGTCWLWTVILALLAAIVLLALC